MRICISLVISVAITLGLLAMHPKAWWLEHVITLIGFLIAALVVVWQMGRQYKSGLNLQRKNISDALKLKIFHTINKKISALTSSEIKVNNFVLMLTYDLPKYLQQNNHVNTLTRRSRNQTGRFAF